MSDVGTDPDRGDGALDASASGDGAPRDGVVVELTLISHTNTGKTTLARTLLSRDVGEVRDAPHVTLASARYPMLETAQGDRLVLTDTPGFADSARLARRLAQQGNPIGWFLTQVWDRWRDRPLWLAQMAVRSVRDGADVVLYLVNAIESPDDAGYLAPELDVLAWIGKPAIVLLNQTGRPRPADEEAEDVARWARAVAAHPFVHGVLTFDAFARCWPQEIVLLRAIAPHLPAAKHDGYARLQAAWQAKRLAAFDEAMAALARPLALAASDRASLPVAGLAQAARDLVRTVARRGAPDAAQEAAMASLSTRLTASLATATDEVVAIHALPPGEVSALLARLSASVTEDPRLPEGTSALVGGVLSGALSGLVADLASGGLTLGAGLVAGTVLGALGGATLARGYNVARGTEETVVRWSDAFLQALAEAIVLRYLAIAHVGRGRGPWTEPEYPPFWREAVARALAGRRAAFDALRERRAREDAAALQPACRDLLAGVAIDALAALYPDALAPTATDAAGTEPPPAQPV